jgi:pimeloyl-ACP methyl ester carboxylesterase
MLHAKLAPTDSNEHIGDEVILYCRPVLDLPMCDREDVKNTTLELEVDEFYLTVGERTIGPYELKQHCYEAAPYPYEVHTSFPRWICWAYPGQAHGLTDEEDPWITAKLGDSINFFYHLKADVHSVNPKLRSGWSGDLSVRIELTVSKIPWILIHGWDAGPEKWDIFERFLKKDRTPHHTVDLRKPVPVDADDWQNGAETNPDIRARRLAWQIDWFIRPGGKINLVGHSQGGLDARAYIRDLGEKAKDKVHSIVMIATPNHGTRGVSLRDWWYRRTFRPWRCTPWLTPGEVEKFNRKTPLAKDIDYYTVAGLLEYSPFSLKKDRLGSLAVPGGDDGVVPVRSVHLDGATVLGPSTGEGTFPYGHNELVTRKEVYDAIKKEIDPAYSEEPNSLAFVAIEDGEVLPAQSVSRLVTMDDVNEVAFVLISGGPLRLSLQSPGGESITPESSNPNISHDSGEWLDLQAQAYVVQKPGSGVWKAEVTGGAEPDYFILIVSAENTFVLDGSTDEYFSPAGEEVRLRAALDADATIANMQVDITDPNGSREMVVLYDDGLHGDDAPNDGVYGNVFFPSLEGEYTLVFSAKGVLGGREFSRADLESISVSAPTMPAH